MLKEERWQKILHIVETEGFVRSENLAQQLNCAEITIRRDLISLDKLGRLAKVHGGAVSNKEQKAKVDHSVGERTLEAASQKQMIAQLALTYISEGSHIYLDAGTSVALLIPLLKGRNVVVYTHGLHHIPELIAAGVPTYIVGGKLKGETAAAVGGIAIKMIETLRIDYAFMGTNGISVEFGLSTPEQEEAIIKETIVKQAKQIYVLADSSKFDQDSYIQFAKKDEVTILTDKKPDEKYKSFHIIHI